MDTIQLSIEELIFSFYSEGLYEQGISIKETYFPKLQDSELKLMLEFAARSLLAKDMAKEVNNQYKLKEEVASFIQILSYAEKTVKASKFDSSLIAEESISFHFRSDEVYLHKLLHDHQVHYISKLPIEEVISNISKFFNFSSLAEQSEVLCKLKNEEFEEFLEDMSQSDSLSASIVQKWISRMHSSNVIEFLEDISKRKGKMDSLLSLKYDANNNPDLIDLYFVIPGKTETWLLTRDANLDLEIQRINESSIKNILLNNKILSV
ncbi:hypothetical protein H1Z61_06875 [Bacillus aquiflavi]|uniref:Uncharacterized protein n=1 Tax=Bacillus aquiflavi TaxID=2672567 RepID=A0A6B3VY49_9BACI|nr:hypothetical protein [Bacillus aquiflavi]MBA4536870.1 hypothetical protein [Bacillus aquiflavi]NEY81237.1 hypothetical protein [Bacillus aquiflavi]UAC48456.1 hypothetical protein K6959_00045 [Bacillus aquiflavi]